MCFIGRDKSQELEYLRDEREGLMERLNRIETIITTGRSWEKLRDENIDINPVMNTYDCRDQIKPDLSPIYNKRSAVSPIPVPRIEHDYYKDNSHSHKISKKTESKSKMYWKTKDPLTYRNYNYQ